MKRHLLKLRKVREERGVVAAVTALFMAALFFSLAAISVDVARWYVEIQRVQNAADAGALAGVTYMPQDLVSATSRAREVSARNGFPNSGTKTVTTARGVKPGELRVTVTSTIPNLFGRFFGKDSTRVSRSSLADYNGPQPMGSPCNTYGNEPPGTTNAGPTSSQLSVPAGATCPRTPDFWYTVHGPEVYKTQGDQYMTRVCAGTESGCTGTTNNEFRAEGYFMLVRVLPAAVGSPLTIQLYDPAYVSTASGCTLPTSGTNPTGARNPWSPDATDAGNRYNRSTALVNVGGSNVRFCSGDDPNDSLRRNGPTSTVTSYALRAPTDDKNPTSATPVSGCTRQWPGYSGISYDLLHRGTANTAPGTYSANLARVYHQWVPLCTFTPSLAGDYYLQVRTNVALGGAINDACANATKSDATPAACTASYRPPNAATSPVTQQAGDDTSVVGTGSNRFAVRINGAPAASVSVSAYGRMPIFANSDSATTVFNLIRVLPGAAGKSIIFKFFDVGDSQNTGSGGTVTVLRPTEATGSNITNCSGLGHYVGTLATCAISGIRGDLGWNGQSQTIVVPIPPNYNCNFNSPGGCWFRVQIYFPAGSGVTDATTWTASVSGDPVRLVE